MDQIGSALQLVAPKQPQDFDCFNCPGWRISTLCEIHCYLYPQKSWHNNSFLGSACHMLCFEKTNHSIKAQKNFLTEFISFCHQIIGRVLVNFSNSIQLALLSRHATAQRNMSRLLASVCENSKNGFLVMLSESYRFPAFSEFQSTSQLHKYSQLIYKPV